VSLPRVLVPLLAAAAGILGGLAFMNAVGPKLDLHNDSSSSNGGVGGTITRDAAGVPVIETPSGPPPERLGGDDLSLFRPEQFAKVISILRKEGGGNGAKIDNLRLAGGRANVILKGDGKNLDLYIIPGGKIYARTESPITGAPSSDDVRVGQLRAGAPWRALKNLQRKSGVTPDDIDYMVATANGLQPKGAWLMYPTKHTGSYWYSALNGAHPQRCC
jgi:hypothetical protein